MTKQIPSLLGEPSSSEKFARLYEFAQKYARVCRSELIEVEDAVQEMMLKAITCPYKGNKYVKQAMRNHLQTIMRHNAVIKKYFYPWEAINMNELIEESESRWGLMLEFTSALRKAPKTRSVILKGIYHGKSIKEIGAELRISRMTIYRYIKQIKQSLLAIL